MSTRDEPGPSSTQDGRETEATVGRSLDLHGIDFGAILLVGALFALAAALIVTAWVSDDALITLHTIDQFLAGRGLRFNAIERVQAFTHPLWLFFVTPFFAVTREGLWAAIVPSWLCTVGAIFFALRVCGARQTGGWVCVLALATSKSFVDYATSGLENPLTNALLAGFALAWLGRVGGGVGDALAPRRVFVLSLLTALVFTTRADATLFVAPTAIALGVRALLERRLVASLPAALVGVVPALVWMGFAWLYFGAPWPNTAYAKLSTGIDRELLLAQGFVYLRVFVDADPAGALVLMAGGIAGLASRRREVRLLAAGVPLYVGYVVWIGGDFMAGRFLATPIFVAALLLGRAASDAGEGRAAEAGDRVAPPAWPARFGPAIAIAATCVAALSPGSPLRVSPSDTYALIDATGAMPAHGIVDERLWYYTRAGAFSVHRDNGLVPRSACTPAAEPRVIVRNVCGGLGRTAFEGCADDHWIDPCGLSDAFLARRPLPDGAVWRIGHFPRAIPRGYRQSVIEGRPRMNDASLDAAFEQTLLETRAPVWAPERLVHLLSP